MPRGGWPPPGCALAIEGTDHSWWGNPSVRSWQMQGFSFQPSSVLWHRDRHITSGRVACGVLGLDGDCVDSSVSLQGTFRAQFQVQVARDYPVGREIAVAKTRDRLVAPDGLDFAGNRSAVVDGADRQADGYQAMIRRRKNTGRGDEVLYRRRGEVLHRDAGGATDRRGFSVRNRNLYVVLARFKIRCERDGRLGE